MWLALSLKKTATIGIFGHQKEMQLADMADGCCGVLLAFETKEAAAEYTGEGGSIIEIAEVK